MKVGEFFDKWLGRLSGAYGLYPLVPAGIIALVTAAIARTSQYISDFGWFGIWLISLGTFFMTALAFFLLAVSREKWLDVSFYKESVRGEDPVNPVDSEFHKKRIKLISMIKPSSNYIEGKKFTDCELIGPMMVQPRGTVFSNVGYVNCNWVLAKRDAVIFNAKGLRNVEVTRGIITNVTFLISEDDIDLIRHLSVSVINRTGDSVIDERVVQMDRRLPF